MSESSLKNASYNVNSVTLTLPANSGTNGQQLTTDGTGNLSWNTTIPTGGSSGQFLKTDSSDNLSWNDVIPTGGSNGQLLKTDGSGNLSWTSGTISNLITEGNTIVETIDSGIDGHIKFTTEGIERMRVIPNGNIGIGTNSPQYLSGSFLYARISSSYFC